MFPTTPRGQRVPGQIQLVDDIILKTGSREDALMLGLQLRKAIGIACLGRKAALSPARESGGAPE